MRRAVIARPRCVTCRRCLAACPAGAIRPDGDSYVVDDSLCRGCAACAPLCRTDAIRMAPAAGPGV